MGYHALLSGMPVHAEGGASLGCSMRGALFSVPESPTRNGTAYIRRHSLGYPRLGIVVEAEQDALVQVS